MAGYDKLKTYEIMLLRFMISVILLYSLTSHHSPLFLISSVSASCTHSSSEQTFHAADKHSCLLSSVEANVFQPSIIIQIAKTSVVH